MQSIFGRRFGGSPVLAAVAAEDEEALREALSSGGSASAADADVFALALACCADPANTPGLLRALLAAGADAKQSDSNGSTALHEAALRSNVAAAAVLLGSGADVNANDESGFAPLAHACERARWPEGEAVALALIAAGADPDAAGADHRTPLMRAFSANSPRVLRALLAAGANPALRDPKGRNALYYGVAELGAVSARQLPAARVRLAQSIEAWASFPMARAVLAERDQTPYGMPPLARAASSANADACLALLSAGCDPDQRVEMPGSQFDGQTARELARGDACLAIVSFEEERALRSELGLAIQ